MFLQESFWGLFWFVREGKKPEKCPTCSVGMTSIKAIRDHVAIAHERKESNKILYQVKD